MGSATPLTIWSSFRWWGGCAGGSTSCPRFPQTKSSILGRAHFVGVALFLIARGVPVHEFVVSDRHAGLQRGYEHRLFNCLLNCIFNCLFNCLFNYILNCLLNCLFNCLLNCLVDSMLGQSQKKGEDRIAEKGKGTWCRKGKRKTRASS